MKKKETEYCEQCKEESSSTKVRWDLEFPLVLCDDCYDGFKRQSVKNTKTSKKKDRMES